MSLQKSTLEFVSWNVNGLRACRKKHLIFLSRIMNQIFSAFRGKTKLDVIPEDDFGYSFRHYHLAEKKGTLEQLSFQKNNHSQWLKVFLRAIIQVRVG